MAARFCAAVACGPAERTAAETFWTLPRGVNCVWPSTPIAKSIVVAVAPAFAYAVRVLMI